MRRQQNLSTGMVPWFAALAFTAVLLASEEGAYYVGATMNPNGGDVML